MHTYAKDQDNPGKFKVMFQYGREGTDYRVVRRVDNEEDAARIVSRLNGASE